jgi:hypothetical protein
MPDTPTNIILDGAKLDAMHESVKALVTGAQTPSAAAAAITALGAEVFGPHEEAIRTGTARLPGFCLFDDTGYDLDLALRSVGAGWAPLLRELYAVMPPGVRVTQVKEKFGGLRFYYGWAETSPYDAVVGKAWETLVQHAETRSYRTCETCGAAGHVRPHGWVTTLCDACDLALHAASGYAPLGAGGAACCYRSDEEDG